MNILNYTKHKSLYYFIIQILYGNPNSVKLREADPQDCNPPTEYIFFVELLKTGFRLVKFLSKNVIFLKMNANLQVYKYSK